MQISSRFTIATHMLIVLALEGKTKNWQVIFLLAVSVSIQLLFSNLVPAQECRDDYRCSWDWRSRDCQDLKDISLLDVYSAVECLGKSASSLVFSNKPNPDCPIGKNIHNVLDDRLAIFRRTMKLSWLRPALTKLLQQPKKKLKNNLS